MNSDDSTKNGVLERTVTSATEAVEAASHRRNDATTSPSTGVIVSTTAAADDMSPATACIVSPVPGAETAKVAGQGRGGGAESESAGVGGVTSLSANDISQLEFLTVEECAQYLRLDRKTVYSMIRRGELPGARRCGRTYRIHRASVVSSFSAKPHPVHHGGKR